MKALQVFYCGGCGVASENLYWVVCKCKRLEVHRMAIRAEDADQVRAALRRGGRVQVGQASSHFVKTDRP